MKRSWPNTGSHLFTVLALVTVFCWMSSPLVAQEAPQPEAEQAVDTPDAAPAPAPDAAATEPSDAAAAPAPEGEAPAAGASTEGDLEDQFSNYLHFAMIGQFEIADRFGQALLARPELNPLSDEAAKELLSLSEKYRNSIETLLLMINNTPIAENAKKVLDVIRQAHSKARQAPERIVDNIKLLGGTPMQQSVGLERLVESGEYAVPWLIQALADPGQSNLHPFIIRALPALGRRAVNPLVVALQLDNPTVTGAVAETLGRIGYPQSLPYLKRLADNPEANAAVRQTAGEAIQRIVVADPRVKALPAAELFEDLAEKYYAKTESLMPDPREDRANVWFLRDGILTPVEVPQAIYPYVMTMRSAEDALALRKERPEMVALWLAADFHREAAMGLEVTDEQVVQTTDLTHPADFPRSIYFARTAGPLHTQLALARAIQDRDPIVALGSIAALHVTAGPVALVEAASREGASLPPALNFPDLLVRIRAALALGQALPQQPFRGADQVVPTLASALQLTGRKAYLVVSPDDAVRDALAGELTRAGAAVAADATFPGGFRAAQKQFSHLDGIFLATNAQRPSALEAVRELKRDERFGLTPIVLIVRPGDDLQAERIVQEDSRVGRVLLEGDAAQVDAQLAQRLLARRDEIAAQFGAREMPAETGLDLALAAARTLERIAINRSPVFDIAAAESSLILALAHPSEELRIASAAALALINSPSAQQSLAIVALNPDQSETLRTAAFASLAESARRFGPKLEDQQMQKLVEQATREANLSLRTAASQAFGAMRPPGGRVAEIILQK